MNKKIKNKAIHQRKYKILGLFLFLLVAMGIFLFSVLKTIVSERRIPSHNTIIYDRSLRGSIISADNYTLSSSQKTYQAVIRGASIVPGKKEVFIKLFSIYSGIPETDIRKRFKNRKGKEIQGNIVLSKHITSRHAMQLKSLAYKLRKLGIFRSIKNRNGIEVLYGLDIVENGETRRFPLGDVMSPVLGYVGNKSNGRYTRPEGKKGLERKYEKHITSKKNGYFKGKRDVVGAVIHDKNSVELQRMDGMDLHLNIPLALQRRIELMMDLMKKRIDADEILVGVMESKTGKVLSLASSERYDPAHITQKDIPALNPKFSEYPYEAGSVLKPITLAIALDHKVVQPMTVFNTYNGRLKIGKRRTITDDEKFDSLTATDIIVHSSNVGISQISWKLTGQEFREGLLKFGIARPSGLDLSRDLPGKLKPLHLLNNKMHRANSAYGYGMLVTFAQLFKAYSTFNNNGIEVTPRIVDYLQDAKGNHYTLEPKVGDLHTVNKKTADQIHNILLEVVKRGTGVKAQYPGLEIGGKTGTAHIAKHGRYVREYHSSFYGFANDKAGHKYTIGVLVIRAKGYLKYFASQSAVPTFKNIVRILVEQGYLKVDPREASGTKKEAPLYESEKPVIQTEVATPPDTKIQKKPAKKKSVKELFELKKKPALKKKPKTKIEPKVQSGPKLKPATERPVHELFDEDLF
ncbi:MAG: cell division protein FtsI [Epsilonproteobacteria bacterium (ex Lamellibrachia satsuma)]|nr:MAG: cell division protein FtsI [Epsilonproteobacteria bacterium (ex Lamellibrachia satsuma)]